MASNNESNTPTNDFEHSRSRGLTSFKNKIPKNLNIYWLLVTAIAVWFLFVHTPRYLVRKNKLKDAMVWLHMVGACGVYLACIFNTMVTPSRSRVLHTWVGRAGLILGLWGFGWGAWLSWGRPNVNRSFSIPITIGGVLQLICETMGYYAIRNYKAVGAQLKSMPPNTPPVVVEELKATQKGHLRTHIGYMLGLFVQACSIPALIRFTHEIGGVPLLVAAIVGLNAIIYFYTQYFFTRIRDKSSSNVADEANIETPRVLT